MKKLIVGSEGSMGNRYKSILKYLGVEFECADVDSKLTEIYELSKSCSGIIIASPTETHYGYLYLFANLGIPILCEKPLSKSRNDLDAIKDLVDKNKMNLTMMLQYSILDDKNSVGLTSYNYYKHGNDSLIWDCIQLIGLARGKVEIGESSPIWQCTLNGKPLSLADMDHAYIEYVMNWLTKPGQDINVLLEMHRKTALHEEKQDVLIP